MFPAKTNDLLLQFFVKPHLVEFLLIMIVLFMIPTRFSSHVSVPVFKNFFQIEDRSRTPEVYQQYLKGDCKLFFHISERFI